MPGILTIGIRESASDTIKKFPDRSDLGICGKNGVNFYFCGLYILSLVVGKSEVCE